MDGQTEAVLLSLLEVDKDISTRLNKITEEEPELMEVIRTSIEAVTSVLFQGLEKKNLSGRLINKCRLFGISSQEWSTNDVMFLGWKGFKDFVTKFFKVTLEKTWVLAFSGGTTL